MLTRSLTASATIALMMMSLFSLTALLITTPAQAEDLDLKIEDLDASLRFPGVVPVIDRFPSPAERGATLPPATALTDAPFPLEDTLTLHSNPGATKIVYLDFDGHSVPWAGSTYVYPAWNWEGSPKTLSDDELTIIQLVWWSVAEDFMPFDIDVTTEEPDIEALKNTGGDDAEWGVRAVINHLSYNYSWAYSGTFTSAHDDELFAWSGNFSDIYETWLWTADSVSHEVGHTLGLADDGTTTGLGYYPGHGTGDVSWSPIMGWTNYGLSQWDRGDYPDANTVGEDDLAIITSLNGFDYRVDDHGSSVDTATVVDLDKPALVDGLIEQSDDLDTFQLELSEAGQLLLRVEPDHISPNLDIAAVITDQSGTILAESNPLTALYADFDLSLEAGTYFLTVDGTGYDDPDSPGYSDYGSLGFYSFEASVEYAVDTGEGDDVDTGEDDDVDTGEDDDVDTGEDDTDTAGEVSPAEPAEPGSKGCGCSTGGAGGFAGLLLLPLLVLRRRSTATEDPTA
jgi:MYXO-CTERM domain-containing protein